MTRKFIRIINTPDGDGPEEFNKAWVGAIIPLPLYACGNPDVVYVKGKKSGREEGRIQSGFIVKVDDALQALKRVRPDIAQCLMQRGYISGELIFEASACKVIEV